MHSDINRSRGCAVPARCGFPDTRHAAGGRIPEVILALAPLALAFLLALASPAQAQPRTSAGEVPEVGVREKVGTTLPLDLPLRDEQGGTTTLRAVVDRPTLMLFVYYRCTAICDPLMREVAHNLDLVDLVPGQDYRVVLVSFDPDETPEIARTKKGEILASTSRRPPDDAWRFLTGTEENVKALTEAAGFHYQYDPKTDTYVHASSLVFLTREGRIARYLGGVRFLPSEIKMALVDATLGRERSFMQKVAGVCYSYDPESRTYVLVVNRIILGVTGVIVLAFVGWLVLGRRPPRPRAGGE